MDRLFICQVIPKNKITTYTVSQAANNFCYNLIDGDVFNDIISIVPINIKDKISFDSSGENTIRFVQKRVFPHIGVLRMFNVLLENIAVTRYARKAETIWFYNLTIHNILSCLVLKCIYKRKIYLILADYTPSNSVFSVQYLIKYIISKLNGVVSLSNRTEIKNSNMNYIAGIVTKPEPVIHAVLDQNKFLFSGGLEKWKGVDMALKVFSKLPNSILYITGRGGDEKLCIEYSEKYENIIFLGFMEIEDYIKLLDNINVCLNFRNPKYQQNINNFPSKVLEYFYYDKAVLSTILYPELDGFNYLYCEYDELLLVNAIEQFNISEKQNTQKFFYNRNVLFEKFSVDAWKKKILQTELIG